MRKLIILSGMVLLLCLAIPATAQDISDYGIPLNIEFPEDLPSESGSANPLAWSPDGEWIAFVSGDDRLWIIPAEGGEARLLFQESYFELPDSVLVGLSRSLYGLPLSGCFTPNSQELTFAFTTMDEEKGSEINLIENPYSGGYILLANNPVCTIKSINIYTGELRDIVDGKNPAWSSCGRYLCYEIFDYRKNFDELQAENDGCLAILDTETGEKRVLTDGSNSISSVRFTKDDSAVIFLVRTDDNIFQFFKVSVTGDEIEQLTLPTPNMDIDKYDYVPSNIDISPDGEWLMYLLSYSDSQEVYFYNFESGDVFKLSQEPPYPDIQIKDGLYSPDGSQIMYALNNNVYIRDIDPYSFQKILTGEEILAVEDKPQSFPLLSNYPNPFNPQTTIEFSLPEAGFAELSVYNLAGQKVCELMAGEMSAGVHSAVWDGRDQLGNSVSSGVYVSRLRTRDNVFSNRMILTK